MMDDSEELLQCYNKGCSKKFQKKDNTGNVCQYHPGQPIFHDAYKIWSCCRKKSIDFTEFLNIAGCTFGKHSDDKPKVEKALPTVKKDDDFKEIVRETYECTKPVIRSDYDSELIELKPIISTSLQKKMLIDEARNQTGNEEQKDLAGKACMNRGCTKVFIDDSTNQGQCTYHPGTPTFHDSHKYWSCCRKMTADFSTFVNQIGCSTGKHKWMLTEDEKIDVRWDYHQTDRTMTVTIYTKDYQPLQSDFRLSPIRLAVMVRYNDNATFKLTVELCKVIDVTKSAVNMFPTKIEINLAKLAPVMWPKLEFAPIIHEGLVIKKSDDPKEVNTNDRVDLSSL